MTTDDKYTQSNDRFDLEQLILRCWGITEDIDLIAKQLNSANIEDTRNHLEGLKVLCNLRFEALFDLFENMVKEKQIR